MNMEIRRLETEDSGSIVNLEAIADKELGEWNPAPEKHFQDSIKKDRDIIWVAELEGKIVGYIEGALLRKDEADIVHLFVLKEHRNRGVEEKLVKAFLDAFRSRGFGRIYVIGAREEETELYKRFGFGTITYNMKLLSE